MSQDALVRSWLHPQSFGYECAELRAAVEGAAFACAKEFRDISHASCEHIFVHRGHVSCICQGQYFCIGYAEQVVAREDAQISVIR